MEKVIFTGLSHYPDNKLSDKNTINIFLSINDDDFDIYFKEIADEIIEIIDDAIIWYIPKNSIFDKKSDEILNDSFQRMRLFVYAITSNFYNDQEILCKDVKFALDNNASILPIVLETGLDNQYISIFSDRQYLQKNFNDSTSLDFQTKMKIYLDSILVNSKLCTEIRTAFVAYVFMSYRKKDRKYAQEIIHLIHEDDECKNIAIWYDEYLTPGEDFQESIRDMMEKSNIFALLVTPNILEYLNNTPNYVLAQEYPLAKTMKENNTLEILPIEVQNTDHDTLYKEYKNLPATITRENIHSSIKQLVKDALLKYDKTNPINLFFLGLAYLDGIDFEINKEYALNLITQAANLGLPEAYSKLSTIYRYGNGTAKDIGKAIKFQSKYISMISSNPDNALRVAEANRILSAIYEEINELQLALQYQLVNYNLLKKIKGNDVSIYEDLIESCDIIGNLTNRLISQYITVAHTDTFNSSSFSDIRNINSVIYNEGIEFYNQLSKMVSKVSVRILNLICSFYYEIASKINWSSERDLKFDNYEKIIEICNLDDSIDLIKMKIKAYWALWIKTKRDYYLVNIIKSYLAIQNHRKLHLEEQQSLLNYFSSLFDFTYLSKGKLDINVDCKELIYLYVHCSEMFFKSVNSIDAYLFYYNSLIAENAYLITDNKIDKEKCLDIYNNLIKFENKTFHRMLTQNLLCITFLLKKIYINENDLKLAEKYNGLFNKYNEQLNLENISFNEMGRISGFGIEYYRDGIERLTQLLKKDIKLVDCKFIEFFESFLRYIACDKIYNNNITINSSQQCIVNKEEKLMLFNQFNILFEKISSKIGGKDFDHFNSKMLNYFEKIDSNSLNLFYKELNEHSKTLIEKIANVFHKMTISPEDNYNHNSFKYDYYFDDKNNIIHKLAFVRLFSYDLYLFDTEFKISKDYFYFIYRENEINILYNNLLSNNKYTLNFVLFDYDGLIFNRIRNLYPQNCIDTTECWRLYCSVIDKKNPITSHTSFWLNKSDGVISAVNLNKTLVYSINKINSIKNIMGRITHQDGIIRIETDELFYGKFTFYAEDENKAMFNSCARIAPRKCFGATTEDEIAIKKENREFISDNRDLNLVQLEGVIYEFLSKNMVTRKPIKYEGWNAYLNTKTGKIWIEGLSKSGKILELKQKNLYKIYHLKDKFTYISCVGNLLDDGPYTLRYDVHLKVKDIDKKFYSLLKHNRKLSFIFCNDETTINFLPSFMPSYECVPLNRLEEIKKLDYSEKKKLHKKPFLFVMKIALFSYFIIPLALIPFVWFIYAVLSVNNLSLASYSDYPLMFLDFVFPKQIENYHMNLGIRSIKIFLIPMYIILIIQMITFVKRSLNENYKRIKKKSLILGGVFILGIIISLYFSLNYLNISSQNLNELTKDIYSFIKDENYLKSLENCLKQYLFSDLVKNFCFVYLPLLLNSFIISKYLKFEILPDDEN